MLVLHPRISTVATRRIIIMSVRCEVLKVCCMQHLCLADFSPMVDGVRRSFRCGRGHRGRTWSKGGRWSMQENVRCLPSSKSCVPPSSSSSSTSWSDTDSEVAEPLKEEERQSYVFDCSRNPLEPTLEKKEQTLGSAFGAVFFCSSSCF